MTEQLGGVDQRDYRQFLSELDNSLIALEKLCEAFKGDRIISRLESRDIRSSLLMIESQLQNASTSLENIIERHPLDSSVYHLKYILSLFRKNNSELCDLANMRVTFQSLNQDQFLKYEFQKKIESELLLIRDCCLDARNIAPIIFKNDTIDKKRPHLGGRF